MLRRFPRAALAASFPRLLPTSCAVCGLAPGPLCAACEDDYFPAERPRCAVCAIALHGPDPVCGRCLASPPHFHRTTALGDYAPPVDGMVTALKFGARLDLAAFFGGLLARRLAGDADARVLAVPLAFERMSERGFNQSLQIARAFARASGRPLAGEVVQRVRHTPPQQSLALDARRRSIRGAFAARGRLDGASLIVVDDVMTSGSTMDELARVLVAAGAMHVHALVVARTP
jgi:ComF family protein